MGAKGKATVIKVGGSEEELDHRPTLAEAQGVVGGFIELTQGILNGKVVTLVLDEEGKLKNKEINLKATSMYWSRFPGIGDIIVGDVIVLKGWRTVGG